MPLGERRAAGWLRFHVCGHASVAASRISRSPFRPGDKVDDRYLIDGYIARGGMSVVYRAIDTRLDRPVALKVLRSDLASREEFRKGFVAEAKTVANLRGPGIVTVSDQGMWKGEAFLVMELVAGGTVRELLNERGPMPPYAAVAVLKPTLEALAVAHRSGFVHRERQAGEHPHWPRRHREGGGLWASPRRQQ